MDLDLSFLIATTASIIILTFLYQTFIQKKPNTNTNSPPHASGAWPIIGHLHLLGGDAIPHRVFGNLADKYGPIFTIKLGVHQAVIVNDAELAKSCFTVNDKAFASRPKSLLSVIMGYNYAMFPLSQYGEYYTKMSKMAKVELLSQKRVEMIKDIRVSEVRTFMKNMHDDCLKNKTNTVKVEMREFFANLVLNIITRSVASKRFTPGDEEANKVHDVVTKFFEYLGTFVVSDFLPFLKFLDLGGHVKGMTLAAKDMDDIIEVWLDDHKKRRASGKLNEENPDYMDTLLNIVENASKDEFGGYDNDTLVKASSLTMITAGFDSTAVALAWTITLLLNNPEKLKLAQEEMDRHVGRDRLVDESDIKNLVYLQAIIKESLRIHPPAPIAITRQSREDCVVGGYMIPEGTLFIPNIWKIHHNPDVWDEPSQFRPERFLTDKKNFDVKGQHFDLLPFGSGRRMCLGASFALNSMQSTLAGLIQGFDLAKTSNEPIDTKEKFQLTNHKKYPLEVLLTPRLSRNLYNVNA
uniref:Cytochrome P540 n=1 Tax=Stevia rebaudiana TaxID=55670 RepID=A0A7T1IDM5_STERE|nr:cytochrome P540 [Stevia rebaudiana]